MKYEKRKITEAKTVKVLKEPLWFKNYQQRNVFTSEGGSNEKRSLKLDVPKFQKWSNHFKNLSFQQNPLKKPVVELSLSVIKGLKPVTLLKQMNPFCGHFRNNLLRNSSKRKHIKGQPFIG